MNSITVQDFSGLDGIGETAQSTINNKTTNYTYGVTTANGSSINSNDLLASVQSTDASGAAVTPAAMVISTPATRPAAVLAAAALAGSSDDDVAYAYDAEGDVVQQADYSGTTDYGYNDDGEEDSSDDTSESNDTETDGGVDPADDDETTTTLPDGQTDSTPENGLDETAAQSGEGLVPATYNYDPNSGELLGIDTYASEALTSAVQDQTEFAYDSDGNLTGETYGAATAANKTTDTYNYAGQQLSSIVETTATGATFDTITTVPGTDNRPVGQKATLSGTMPAGVNATVGYTEDNIDDQGNVKEIQGNDAYGNYTRDFTYDDDGNLMTETDNRLSGISVGYQYTPEDQTSAETLSSGGTAVNSQNYTYDQNSGLMTNAMVSNAATPTPANSQTFNYTYIDGNSEIGSITTTLPGGGTGPTTTYSYDSDTGWLDSIAVTNPGGATLYSISYTRDDDGRILTATTGGAATITYTYDPTTGQLATVTPAGGSTTTYSFDASGNLTNLYGGPNNLDEYNNFSYNANGDLTDDGTNTYAYDGLDRLISVTPDLPAVGSVMTTFDYNEENYRTAKTDFTWSGSAWVQSQELKYTYDASGNLEAEFNVTFNGGTETDTLLQTYGWSSDGSTLLSITMYNANGSVSGTYLPVTDGNGNITALIDAATGTVAATYTYDAFGNLLSYTGSTVALANPFRFDSCYCDTETGLYYNLNRYYSPSQGRFITRDPSGQNGGLNLYAYCQNDPVNNCDPIGLGGDTVYCQEGRVAGAAIEAQFKAANPTAQNQVDIVRTYNNVPQDGTADIGHIGRYSEVGPASVTGVSDKVFQMKGIQAANQGDIYLYRQTGSVPNVNSQVEYVKMSYSQAQTLLTKIKDGMTSEEVWGLAKNSISGEVSMATVSESAYAQAGSVYFRDTKYTSPPITESAPSTSAEPASGVGLATPEAEGTAPVRPPNEGPLPGAQGMVRAIAVLNVYLTVRAACQAEDFHGMDLESIDAPYCFTDCGGVFTVQKNWIDSDTKTYIAGQWKGMTVDITRDQANHYQEVAEKKFGKLIPGTIFTNAKFIPGTDRQTLPIYDIYRRETGYIDENGVHNYNSFEIQSYNGPRA